MRAMIANHPQVPVNVLVSRATFGLASSIVTRSRSPLAWFGAVLAACVALLAAPANAGAQQSTAVVVLGDSAASGDGAGDYEPGTRGEGDNWCHRSEHAY